LQDWPLGASLYYCFISLTTIGFGDLWPVYTVVHAADGFGAILKMVIAYSYIIVGDYAHLLSPGTSPTTSEFTTTTRQRRGRLERFPMWKKNLFVFKTH
jgi:hypothetical protein